VLEPLSSAPSSWVTSGMLQVYVHHLAHHSWQCMCAHLYVFDVLACFACQQCNDCVFVMHTSMVLVVIITAACVLSLIA
jgi:hypothetical protein